MANSDPLDKRLLIFDLALTAVIECKRKGFVCAANHSQGFRLGVVETITTNAKFCRRPTSVCGVAASKDELKFDEEFARLLCNKQFLT
jgi:hypothetical protein